MSASPIDRLKPFQKSLENTVEDLDQLLTVIFETTEPLDRLNFYISILAPWSSHASEHRQNVKIGQLVKTTPQSVWNWRAGVSQCGSLGRLYGFARLRFPSEVEMARAFGEFIGRDLIAEVSK